MWEILRGLKPDEAAQLSLAVNGFLVAILMIAAYRFLGTRRTSEFREDLWDASQKSPGEIARLKDAVDQIALGGPEVEEETTERTLRPENEDITAPGPKPAERLRVPKSDSPFATPKFTGKPHEVLGISEAADRATVLAAYKHWIKRYHPDRVQHLGPGYVYAANKRTEALNFAKDTLLSRL